MIELRSQSIKLVDTHIKKTGGTSILNVYNGIFNPDKIFVYNSNNEKFAKLKEKTPTHNEVVDKIYHEARRYGSVGILLKLKQIFIKYNRHGFKANELPADWEVISGHFTTKKIFDELPTNERYLFTAVIRDPLERMISHYEYWLLWRKDTNKTSFEKFAYSEENINFQTKSIGSFDHNNLLLGTTQNLNRFIHRVLDKLDVHPLKPIILRRLNRNPDSRTLSELGVTSEQSFRSHFENENSLDYTLYAKAVEQNK